VTQRQHPLARRVSSVTSNLIKVVILINNKITVKVAFNSEKFLLIFKLVDILPTGASPLDITGRLLSPYPLNQPPPLVYCTNTTLDAISLNLVEEFHETCYKYSPCEWELMKMFPRSEVKGQGHDQSKCYEACISTVWRRGSLVCRQIFTFRCPFFFLFFTPRRY